MSVIIAIPSCTPLHEYEQCERDTWIKDIPEGVDYRFFLGGPKCKEDEVSLGVEDDIKSLTKKIVAMYRWVLEKGYDHVFKCDLDTLVRPKLLMDCKFEQHDYMGGKNDFFASGGAGYWLSRKAMKCVVDKPIETEAAEDVHVARAVLKSGMHLHADSRFKYHPYDCLDDATISYHLGSVFGWGVKYLPEKMKEYYPLCGTVPVKREVKWRRLR
jgi:hypothetical protein